MGDSLLHQLLNLHKASDFVGAGRTLLDLVELLADCATQLLGRPTQARGEISNLEMPGSNRFPRGESIGMNISGRARGALTSTNRRATPWRLS